VTDGIVVDCCGRTAAADRLSWRTVVPAAVVARTDCALRLLTAEL